MSKHAKLKHIVFHFLSKILIDSLFRWLNKKKVLILAYHAVTKNDYKTAPWTHISADIFESQIKYINQRYDIISLKDAVKIIISGKNLSKNIAVITFDDGYKNNYTAALPILQKYNVPATIFLTAGYIGSSDFLPLDEIFLILTHCKNDETYTINKFGIAKLFLGSPQDLLNSYENVASKLKRVSTSEQKNFISMLRRNLNICQKEYKQNIVDDFTLLSWDEIILLLKSNLIDIGAHTVSHEILTNLPLNEAARQIVESKSIIQKQLGCDIDMFAYPNGTESDYNDDHINCLKNNGFVCSVVTSPKLNRIFDNPYRLGRMCIGSDYSSNIDHFALNISGFLSAMKAIY